MRYTNMGMEWRILRWNTHMYMVMTHDMTYR